MKLNFSFKKAYYDLFSNKKYIIELLFFPLIYLLDDSLKSAFKLHSSNIAEALFTGYLCLMANNIIQGNEPILGNLPTLANLYVTKDEKTNLLKFDLIWAGFKNSIVQLIYFSVLGILGFLTFMILKTYYGFEFLKGIIVTGVLFSPLIMFVNVSLFVLFCENLSFMDSFNLIKSAKSFKHVWKEYLLLNAVLFTYYLASLFVVLIYKHNIFINTELSSIIKLLFFLFSVIFGYFYSHYIAQSYKYALLQMKLEESRIQNV